MKILAKILAFYFAIGGCLPQTDFSQLVHLPDLLEHYYEHEYLSLENGASLSFFEFVTEHFIETNSHQHGDSSHEKLPFQNLEPAIDFFFNLPLHSTDVIKKSGQLLPQGFLTWLNSDYGKNLFRPPIA